MVLQGPALASGAELTLLLSQAAASPDVKSSSIITASKSTYPSVLLPEETRHRMLQRELSAESRLALVYARKVSRGHGISGWMIRKEASEHVRREPTLYCS
jgi:hypothetical protein